MAEERAKAADEAADAAFARASALASPGAGVATAAVVFNQTSWQSDRLRILLAAGSTTPALYGIAGTLLLGASAVLFPLPPAFRAREGST